MSMKWLTLFPNATKNEVQYLLDGEETFTAIIEAMNTAVSDQHYIYILGWMLDIDFQMVNKDPNSSLINQLQRATTQGVEVRILVWDNLLPNYAKMNRDVIPRLNRLKNTKAVVDEYTFFPQKSKQIIAKLSPRFMNFVQKYASKLLALDKMSSDANSNITGAEIIYRLVQLASNKTIGAHHEKVVIVKGKEGLIAFCGGIDFNKNRVQSTVKGKKFRFPYYHDTACRIKGPEAYDILQAFKRRWSQNPLVSSVSLRGENEKKPKSASQDHPWAEAVWTYNSVDGKIKDRSFRDAYMTIIENAEYYIYIEDQYLVNLDVARALNKKVKEPGFKKLTFVIQDSNETADIMIPNRKRGEFYQAVLDGTNSEQKKKVLLALPDKRYWEKEHYHPGVHAKTLIVDDEIAIIGSGNVNRRSFTVDSETSIVVFDDERSKSQKRKNFAWQFRKDTWKHYFRKLPDPPRYEDWFIFPTMINNLTDHACMIVKYTQDSQPDLDIRLADMLRGIGGAVVIDEQVTVNPDGTKDITIITLNKHTIEALFDRVWEHFIDPDGG